MTEKNEQQRGREEDLMARGPVSAGASQQAEARKKEKGKAEKH